MRRFLPLILLTPLLFALPAPAQTARSAATTGELTDDATPAGLVKQGDAAAAAGDDKAALDFYKRAAVRLQEMPDRLGPVLDKVAAVEKRLGPAATGAADAAARTPHAVPAGGQTLAFDTIQALGNFEYDPDAGGLPDDVQKLDGSKIRVNGYMIPIDQAGRITRFALVPDLFACCFGQPPGLQHTIIVNCPEGKSVPYYPDPIIVEGTLKVQEKEEDGFVVSLFELDVLSVKAAPK